MSVSAETPAAEGARTIDAAGKTVMPGFIDARCERDICLGSSGNYQ